MNSHIEQECPSFKSYTRLRDRTFANVENNCLGNFLFGRLNALRAGIGACHDLWGEIGDHNKSSDQNQIFCFIIKSHLQLLLITELQSFRNYSQGQVASRRLALAQPTIYPSLYAELHPSFRV